MTEAALSHPTAPPTARRAVVCPTCGLAHAWTPVPIGQAARCRRCSAVLSRGIQHSLARTGAFALAALLLCVPANLFPILNLELYGRYSESTVLDGVREFYEDGDLLMAAIVLMASVVVPVIKILGLLFLVITTAIGSPRWRLLRTNLFRSIDGIGKWAMLDVFVLSIWVAVVKLDSLGSVSPGPGLLPFGCVVILTLLASNSFDPQLIWETDCYDDRP